MGRLRVGERVDHFETVRLYRDGRRIDVSLTASPVRDHDSRVAGASKIARDVTDKKRAEEALRASETRLRRVVESDTIGTFFWRESGGVTDANDAFLALVGYSRDDLRAGRIPWVEMPPPEYHRGDEAALVELAATGRCTPFEKEYVRRDGIRVPVLIGAALVDAREGWRSPST